MRRGLGLVRCIRGVGRRGGEWGGGKVGVSWLGKGILGLEVGGLGAWLVGWCGDRGGCLGGCVFGRCGIDG